MPGDASTSDYTPVAEWYDATRNMPDELLVECFALAPRCSRVGGPSSRSKTCGTCRSPTTSAMRRSCPRPVRPGSRRVPGPPGRLGPHLVHGADLRRRSPTSGAEAALGVLDAHRPHLRRGSGIGPPVGGRPTAGCVDSRADVAFPHRRGFPLGPIRRRSASALGLDGNRVTGGGRPERAAGARPERAAGARPDSPIRFPGAGGRVASAV